MNNKLCRALFIIGTILMLIDIVLDFVKDAPESSPYSMPLLIVGGILVTAARFYKSSKNK